MSSETSGDSVGSASRPPSDRPRRPPQDGETARGGDGDDADGTSSITPGEIHGLLKNSRRRYVVWYLSQTEGQIELRDLAEHVAAWENGKPIDSITSSERKRAYVALYQSHLPRLDEAGVVDFDSDRGIIERGEHADRVEWVLGERRESSWSRYYLLAAGASLLGLLVTLAVARSLSPLAAVYVVATGVTFATLATADDLRSDQSDLRDLDARLRRWLAERLDENR